MNCNGKLEKSIPTHLYTKNFSFGQFCKNLSAFFYTKNFGNGHFIKISLHTYTHRNSNSHSLSGNFFPTRNTRIKIAFRTSFTKKSLKTGILMNLYTQKIDFAQFYTLKILYLLYTHTKIVKSGHLPHKFNFLLYITEMNSLFATDNLKKCK